MNAFVPRPALNCVCATCDLRPDCLAFVRDLRPDVFAFVRSEKAWRAIADARLFLPLCVLTILFSAVSDSWSLFSDSCSLFSVLCASALCAPLFSARRCALRASRSAGSRSRVRRSAFPPNTTPLTLFSAL